MPSIKKLFIFITTLTFVLSLSGCLTSTSDGSSGVSGGTPDSGGTTPGNGDDSSNSGGGSNPNPPEVLSPIANAGSNQGSTGKVFQLNGALSSDPNNLPVTYSWSVTSKPADSSVTFDNQTIATPRATVDKYGSYVLTLTVSNGTKSAFATVTITYERVLEYTNTVPENSVTMLSDHYGLDTYADFSGGYYYDTSKYMTLETTKVNSNGIRVEKINLANDSTQNSSDYDTTNIIYRTCTQGHTCFRGLTHKTDKDKLWIEKLDHVNKAATEFIITSKLATEAYADRSIWNLYVKGNNLYVFRILFTSINASYMGPGDVEIIKLNTNMDLLWDRVIHTSAYGTSPNAVSNFTYNSQYAPWIFLQYYSGKLLLLNTVTGSRQGADEIVINDSNGAVENVYQYLAYDSNVLVGSRSIYPSTRDNGKLYFTDYYNSVTKTQFSTINGALIFSVDENLNPTAATAVTSSDPNYYFNESGTVLSGENALTVDIRSNVTGAKSSSQKGYLEFNDDLSIKRISVIDDLLEDFWGTFVDTLINNIFKMRINGSYYASQLSYQDVLGTKAYNMNPILGANKNFLSVRFNNNYTGQGSLEVNSLGAHPGCLNTASTNTVTSTLPFSTKTLEVRRTSYEVPQSSSRTVTITSHARGVTTEAKEERAPWLCSAYAVDLDTTIRIKAGTTTSAFSHDDGHYRYEIVDQPGKGVLTIFQPANFSVSGNTIVQYQGNAGAQGTDSFKLRALDGTGSKLVNVTVIFK